MSSETLNGIGPKKRRRPRKRSRKSKLKKTNENETNSDDSGLQDSSVTVVADIKADKSESASGILDEHSENKCGCQLEQGVGRKRRRRSRRRKKKLGLVDMLSCETIDDYTTDEYFNAHGLEFVVPAFKVHQRCEHPMYVPKSELPEVRDLAHTVPEADPGPEEDAQNGTSLAHPPKRTKILEEADYQGEAAGHDDEPVLSPEHASEPVNSVDEVNKGDIIYFDQLTLRDSEPVIERRMAKVFLVMKDAGPSNGPSILLRTYVSFDALNPETWYPKEDLLNAEPLIIKFQDLHGIRKMSTDLLCTA
ncbi:unnamed protein product [Allacma fusca]|uniref:Uncharacterized protein n=1 Tax=Allacma fusca TaxID=39272 RepID=A0A8J2LKX0_9HEXA|nr:unnamed protein product [Allacma fusca]